MHPEQLHWEKTRKFKPGILQTLLIAPFSCTDPALYHCTVIKQTGTVWGTTDTECDYKGVA